MARFAPPEPPTSTSHLNHTSSPPPHRQHVGPSLRPPHAAALPPRLHGLLHSPDLQRTSLLVHLPSPITHHPQPHVPPNPRSPDPKLTKRTNSASATKAAPTATTSSTSQTPRTKSRPAPPRSSRASSPSPTPRGAGSPSGSASTAMSPGYTPSRSRASCPTRLGRLSRMSIGYSISREFFPFNSLRRWGWDCC